MARLAPVKDRLPSGEEITLRSATPEDAAVILDALRRIAATTDQIASHPDEFPATVEEEAKILRESEENPSSLYLLALDEDEIICVGSILQFPKRRLSHVGRLGMMVAEAWRNRGVGKLFMRHLIDWAREDSPLEKVILEVFDTNPAGLALYRKLGFVEEGRQRALGKLGPDRYADHISMGLWLRPSAGAKKFFTVTRRVQFAETDTAEVMHFSNYFRWMEEAEHAWFRSLGMSVIQPHALGTVSWPRITVSCEYFAPLRFEDEVEMHYQLVGLSDKTMTNEVVFYLAGQKVARGRTKAVCCRTFEGGKFESIPIPPDIRAKMEG